MKVLTVCVIGLCALSMHGVGCQVVSGLETFSVVDLTSTAAGASSGGEGGGGGGGGGNGNGGGESSSGGGGGGGGANGSGGGGTAAECTMFGLMDCFGSTPRTCDASGHWVPGTPCDAAAPYCIAGKCVAVQPSCDGAAAGTPGIDTGCGAQGTDSCCGDLNVPGGTFNRDNSSFFKATVGPFYLDKYEVTVARFRAFIESGAALAANAPLDKSGGSVLTAGTGWRSDWNQFLETEKASLTNLLSCDGIHSWTDSPGAQEALPMSCVTWYEAFLFCHWDGGRLPTEAEWNFAAAGGQEQRLFPWGFGQPDLSKAVFNCQADGSLPPLNCSQNDILPVGSKPDGIARWGHLDLAGSMAERVFDAYDAYPIPCVNCVISDVSGGLDQRVLRGGGWMSEPGFIGTVSRDAISPLARKSDIGFRCARDSNN